MIQVRETRFDGRYFRSRAEARWALFFKSLGISYEYEPEGVKLWDGRSYLPDFLIKLKSGGRLVDHWIEVKPATWNDNGKIGAFADHLPYGARATQLPGIGLYKDIVTDFKDEVQCWFGSDDGSGGCDYGYMFCVCPDCGAVGFEHGGRAARIECCSQPSNANGHSDKNYQHNHKRIMSALTAALSERFGT